MKAMNVRSAEELAVGSPQGKALFDLTPARSSPAKQSAFTNALKNAALKFRNHAESPPESVETRKSFDSDDPSAAILGMREPSSDVPSQPKAAPVVEASPLSGNREETREPAASVSGETTPPASTEDVQLCGFPRSPWVSGSPAEGRYSVTSPSETANFSAVMAPDSLAPGLETEVAQEKVFPEQVPFLSDIVGSVGNGQEEGEVGWPKLQEIFAESGAETTPQLKNVLAVAFSNRGVSAAMQDSMFLNDGRRDWTGPQHIVNPLDTGFGMSSFDGVVPQAPLQETAEPAGVRAQMVYERLIDQIVQGVRLAHHEEASEIFVHLKPEFLGRMSIRVLANESRMHIEFKVENEMVRQVMQDHMADLQQRLADKGFDFDSFSFLADTGWASRREPELPFAPSASVLEAEPETVAMAAAELAPLNASGAIDYFA